ncbi:hypothetical protein [Dokdonella sp.]|uniref:hypothetical protein n=1 Tax=Dokdonella sp. TaxID=2291710 RepID=UPI002F42A109
MTATDPGTIPRERRERIVVAAAFVALAALLVALALAWRIPMMLWDHLDLVPIYERYLRGTLGAADFFRIHGGHLHAGAYAVLLPTTALSHGRTWLDVLASALFLLGYAAVVVAMASRLRRARAIGVPTMLLFVLLALTPGHLANLQWGWQVAVFVCLAGAASAIALLSAAAFTPLRACAALACAAVAFASFAIGFAAFPVGAVLIASRKDLAVRARWAWAGLWIAVALAAGLALQRDGATTRDVATIALYALDFLGAGIARYATDLAPWLGALGLAGGVVAAWTLRERGAALPWIGLFLFGAASALLTAYGRAGDYGAEQAFVTRYVSFSSVFWIGALGLFALAAQATRWRAGVVRGIVAAVAVLATFEAVHLAKKAATVAARAQATAETIRRTYPDVPPDVLAAIYFDEPGIARERLQRLHAWGFAPFDR